MMSTLSGLILGVVIAAVVTVLYGEQLSTSLRAAVDSSPAVQELRERSREVVATGVGGARKNAQPVRKEPAPVSAGPGIAAAIAQVPDNDANTVAESANETASAPAADANQETTADTSIDASLVASATLEQRWADYARDSAGLAPTGSFPWLACFQRAAASHEMPLALLLAVASGESNFDPVARSDKDAVGLMQIRWPGTSRHLGVRRQADLYDPCTNVDAGARYLKELAQQYGDNLHLAVAAYNYGPARVSAGEVPEGALWYSHYIYQHLQQVLGLEPSATSDLITVAADARGGRQVLMTFSHAYRARDFIAFLNRQVPGLNVQQQREVLGRHDVVLLYSSEADRRVALESMAAAGLESFGQPSNSKLYL